MLLGGWLRSLDKSVSKQKREGARAQIAGQSGLMFIGLHFLPARVVSVGVRRICQQGLAISENNRPSAHLEVPTKRCTYCELVSIS